MKNKFNRNVWYGEELADGLGILTFEELEKIARAPSARVNIHQSGSIDITVDRTYNKEVLLVVKSKGLLPHRQQNAITLRTGDKMFFNPSTNGLWKITENPFSKKPNTDLDPFEQIGEQYGIRKNKFFTTEKNETIIIPKQFRIAEKISQTGEKDIIIAFDNIYQINGNYWIHAIYIRCETPYSDENLYWLEDKLSCGNPKQKPQLNNFNSPKLVFA
jgi:hypothetical protein